MMFFLLRKKIEALDQALAKLSSANEEDNINALRERNGKNLICEHVSIKIKLTSFVQFNIKES